MEPNTAYKILVLKLARQESPLICRSIEPFAYVLMHSVKAYVMPHHTVNLQNKKYLQCIDIKVGQYNIFNLPCSQKQEKKKEKLSLLSKFSWFLVNSLYTFLISKWSVCDGWLIINDMVDGCNFCLRSAPISGEAMLAWFSEMDQDWGFICA